MINHQDVLANGFAGRRQLAVFISTGQVLLAGNRRLKIYGMLQCVSGKRMKTANRVFFANEADAVALGYRPCGHCMRSEYLLWRENK